MNYWFQILKNSKSLAFLIIITFLITLMGLLSPIFIIHIFNRYIAFGLQGTLMFLLLGALSVAVFEFIFRNIISNIRFLRTGYMDFCIFLYVIVYKLKEI